MPYTKEDGVFLAEQIDYFCAKKRMRKSEFYERSGISSAQFSQWNTGKYAPSPASIGKAAEVLGVDVNELLPQKEKPITRADDRLDSLRSDFIALSEEGRAKLLDYVRLLKADEGKL